MQDCFTIMSDCLQALFMSYLFVRYPAGKTGRKRLRSGLLHVIETNSKIDETFFNM